MSDYEIPRRFRLDRNTPEELFIRAAEAQVEALGAHPLLTEAGSLLDQARTKLADWVDQGRPGARGSR